MIRLANNRGSTLTLPNTISLRRIPLTIGVPYVDNPGGHGGVVVGRSRMESRRVSLTGSIYHVSRQQIRDDADNLIQFLQHPPIEVLKWDDERRLYCYPQGVAQDWMDAGAELVVDIPMLVPDPLYYGTEVTADISSPIEVAGTAPTPPVVRIEVTAPGTDLLLTNDPGGCPLLVEGSYLAGDVVTINTATYDATLARSDETAPIVDALGDEFVVRGFELEPGINDLQYSGPTADVTVTYRPRWY